MTTFAVLVGKSYTMFSSKAEIELSINVYRERVESDQGVNPFVLNKSPGLSVRTGLSPVGGAGPVRRMFERNDHVFAAISPTLYDFNSAGGVTAYGGIADDGKPVQFAASTNSLMFVSVNRLYRVNAGVLAEIIVAFVPTSIVFLNNYFVALSADLGQFYISTDDGLTFPTVQTVESFNGNNVLRLEAFPGILWAIGNRVTQPYSVGTNPKAPFDAIQSGFIEAGTNAPNSVMKLGTALFMLERNQEGQHRIMKLTPFQAQVVSDNYVANKIRTLDLIADTSDAVGMSFQLNNQSFYRISFPGADYTLEYNDTLNEWSDPLWWDMATGTYHRHRANCIVSAFGKLFAGDHSNGYIYELSPDVFHDFGYPIRWNRRCPHVVAENKKIAISRLDLGIETGIGLVTPLWLNNYSLQKADFDAAIAALDLAGTITVVQAFLLTLIYERLPYAFGGADYPDADTMNALGFYPWGADAVLSDGTTIIGSPPLITMRYSGNGGKSYSSELSRSLGRAGEDPDVFWNRLGANKDFVADFYGTDPCKLAITNGYFEPEAMLG